MNDKWRILAVDDDRNLLELIRETIGDDYEVLLVEQSEKAITLIELFEPDLVILDIMMPRVNGFQLAEQIKADSKLQHIMIMFLTAKDSQSDMRVGYTKGASLYLTKPFQPERLQKNINLMFERTPPRHYKRRFTISEIKMRVQYLSENTHLENIRHEDDRSPLAKEQENEEDEKETWLG